MPISRWAVLLSGEITFVTVLQVRTDDQGFSFKCVL